MQFSEIQARAAFLAMQAGWDQKPPMPDWKALCNRGLQDFSWDTEYNEEEATLVTVINQSVYTIDSASTPRAFRSFRCVAYGTQTTSPTNLPLSSEGDEAAADPLWWQRPAGTPVRFLIPGPNIIRIVPAPSTAGDTITLRGTREALPMAADADVPAYPATWHEAIALRAAVLHCESWVSGDDAGKLQLYRTQYAGMVRACIEFLSGNRFARLQRRVQRPQRRHTYLRLSGRY
jgi:hypothetical protein